MIEIKADRFMMRRCVYCRGQGDENMFILSDRWDNNPELDPENIVGSTVSRNGELYEVVADDSSHGLGAPMCFQLVTKRLGGK